LRVVEKGDFGDFFHKMRGNFSPPKREFLAALLASVYNTCQGRSARRRVIVRRNGMQGKEGRGVSSAGVSVA